MCGVTPAGVRGARGASKQRMDPVCGTRMCSHVFLEGAVLPRLWRVAVAVCSACLGRWRELCFLSLCAFQRVVCGGTSAFGVGCAHTVSVLVVNRKSIPSLLLRSK